jgi:ArsR family transcriptional regulator
VPKPTLSSRAKARSGTNDQKTLRQIARVFRALADEHRLHILSLLTANGEMSVTAIGSEVGQSQPAVSHHLTQLRSAGLIDFRRDGKFNYYRVDEMALSDLFDHFFPDGASGKLVFGGIEIGLRKK